MKTAGYESCYAAIMGAKLEQPHTYPAFTEYFDVEALDSIRAAYGVDLYNECLKDATAAIEHETDAENEQNNLAPLLDKLLNVECQMFYMWTSETDKFKKGRRKAIHKNLQAVIEEIVAVIEKEAPTA